MNGYDEDVSSLILNIPLTVVNALGTIMSVFLIDKIGRRGSILKVTPVIAASWFVVAGGMYMADNED